MFTKNGHTDVIVGESTEPGHSFICKHPKCRKFWKDIEDARQLADKAELREHGGRVEEVFVLRRGGEHECRVFESMGDGPYWVCGWCGTRLGTKLKEISLGLQCVNCHSVVSELSIIIKKRMRGI